MYLASDVIREAHQELPEAYKVKAGPQGTVRKILLAGLWWPTMTTNVKDFVRACDASQRTGKPGPKVYIICP